MDPRKALLDFFRRTSVLARSACRIGSGREVRGVIVATAISERLRYAASVISNVSLFEYRVEFHLKQVPLEDEPH